MTPYATITPFGQADGTTTYSLTVGWDMDWEEIRNDPSVFYAETPEAAKAAADQVIAADWPRTGDWQPVQVTAWYGKPKVTGWRAPVDPVAQRRSAETFTPGNFRIYDQF